MTKLQIRCGDFWGAAIAPGLYSFAGDVQNRQPSNPVLQPAMTIPPWAKCAHRRQNTSPIP
ncbi:MAG: hypothetical protein VKK80_12310 [Prochlorothrix sp.]|nr:hypothetical protein [Prochlorothrix sp.]